MPQVKFAVSFAKLAPLNHGSARASCLGCFLAVGCAIIFFWAVCKGWRFELFGALGSLPYYCGLTLHSTRTASPPVNLGVRLA
jgi:hypothetical protein